MEQVLVVPRCVLFADAARVPAGFVRGDAEVFLRAVASDGRFVPRASAEVDPSLKQIIPYGVLVHGEMVFLMERSTRGGEARLHGRLSLGVGGHVNPEDLPPEGGAPGKGRLAVESAFAREIREELVVEAPYRSRVVGVINDDSNPVGSVHFGIVYLIQLEAPAVRVREEELLRGEFVPAADLALRADRLETWSRILQEALWPAPPAPGRVRPESPEAV